MNKCGNDFLVKNDTQNKNARSKYREEDISNKNKTQECKKISERLGLEEALVER